MDEYRVINPLKGLTENGWHFEQQVYDPDGITRTVKANGGLGNIPKVILEENKRKEDENLTNTQTTIFEYLGNEENTEKKPFKYISLFAGIGGFDFGLNAVGGECVFASEIDKFAKQAYETLHGIAPHGDITKIKAEDVPDHDVMTAGFPCQSFSTNGKRGGFNDVRGSMFFEVARIAEIKKPKIILIENVKGLLSSDKGGALKTIVGVLGGLGYSVDFNLINSKNFGVPHSRERVYIVAVKKESVEELGSWKTISDSGAVRKQKGEMADMSDDFKYTFNFPKGLDTIPPLSDVVQTRGLSEYLLDEDSYNSLVVGSSTKSISVKVATKKGSAEAFVGDSVNITFPNSKTRRGRVGKQVANTLESSGINQGVVTEDLKIRKFTPKECWRLQGFTDEQHDAVEAAGISNSQRYKQAGNAVTVNVIVALGERLLTYL